MSLETARETTTEQGGFAVEISGLHKWFGNFQVLADINLKVRNGERVVICGPSGSGKSTLIRCINALEDYQRGEVKVEGVPLITVLFMASVMLPLFVPPAWSPDKLLRALVGIALFSSAYMAEVVRAGLLAVPRGQYEAARALGLRFWRTQGLIVLPQALRITIPNIVNSFIALFKDTTLVFFVGHMAGRINVDTVIDLVSEEIRSAVQRLTTDTQQPAPPPADFWHNAVPISDHRRGYLQQLDDDGLADWAAEHKTAIRLLVRPGDYVFPGAPIAMMTPSTEGADAAIRTATALGPQRVSSADLEFAVRQLVEVAVRALSPGVNDPHTAIGVLDRLGAVLCDLVPLHLPTGVSLRDGWPVLVVPGIDYDGLVDAMFHMIRQNAAGNAAVLIRFLEVLTAVVTCEHNPARVAALRRHADLVLDDAGRNISTPPDLDDVRKRHARLAAVLQHGSFRYIEGPER